MWDSATYWTMLAADSLLVIAYLSLAAVLAYLAVFRRDLRYRPVAGLGAMFFLACAADRIADDWTAHEPGLDAATSIACLAALAAVVAAIFVFGLDRALRPASDPEAAARELKQSVAERKHLEEALAKARDEAMAANRAKSRFLAYMSHELRTPLNAILGFSQVIGEELLGPLDRRRYIGYVRDIQSSGEHLLDIVNELLEISRIESGKTTLTETAIAPWEIMADAERMVAARAREAGIALSVTAGRDTPALIADARMVKQILLNLLSNAIKFTPAGGSVGIAAALSADGCISFTVSDTGVGIPANDIARVLEPFGNAQSERPRGNGAGFGLGLPICKALAELHGAAFVLESAVGRGTVARVTFPAARTNVQALAG